MKHFLPCITLFLMLATSTHVMGQDTYEILRIYNAESITIGNRPKKVGDTFKSTDQIVFPNDRQSFKAQKKGTSKAYYFNKKAMEAKKSKTLKDYFANDYNKTKGSTRGETRNTLAINQGKYDVNKYPEKRIALVIGNGNYQELDILPNAINDARDVSDRLKQLGFDVATLYDGDIYDMLTTVDSFFTVAQSYQVALIYFAGHGIRYEGKDYLLSVDRKGLGIKDECSLEYLIAESEKWKSSGKVMIFVIDACRNRAGFANAGDNRAIEAKKGTAILQSTSSGEVAMDADAGSGNSPFASAFINKIGQTGDDLEEEFLDIRREVKRKTSDRQVPRTSLGGGYDFHFCKGCNTHSSQSKTQSTPIPTQNNNPSTNKETTTSNTTQIETSTAEHSSEYYHRGNEEYKKKNYTEAVKWYRLAAEQGHAKAQYKLGECHAKGLGVLQSHTEAIKWFRLAAQQGNDNAQTILGFYYEQGEYISQSQTEAIKWYQLAANQGNKIAQYLLGVYYDQKQSWTDAIKWYKQSANQGYANAQNNLGTCYKEGKGVTKSESEAIKWYKLAADQGYAEAQYNLGEYYYHSSGISHYSKAANWYKLAAEQGHAKAQCALAFCYSSAKGVKASYSEAAKWFRLAAEQGDATAQYNIGKCYLYAIGVPQSDSEAIKWLRLAADQGEEMAIWELERRGLL